MNAAPKFSLSASQQMALVIVELQQQALIAAANMIASPNIGMREVGDILIEINKRLDDAKMKWLHSTQKAIQVASVIPDLKVMRP